MSELIGWLIVIGLAAAISCLFMLSSQLEQHMRNTTEMLLHSNEMILARLEQLANPALQPPAPTLGLVLERRHAQHTDALAQNSGHSGSIETSEFPRRRTEDLLSA